MNLTPEQIAEYLAERKADDDWKAWRDRTNKGMPALAARIFALRDKVYMGYGFHYGMERSLGKLIADLNDFGTYRNARDKFAWRMVVQVCCEGLYKDVVKAERDAASRDAQR